MSLPKFQTDNKDMGLMQTTWASKLDPVLANPLNNGLLLQSVQLKNGTNQVNHLLGRKLQGWFTTRVRATCSLYDTQDTNTTPQLTLSLVSNANVTVDLYVF